MAALVTDNLRDGTVGHPGHPIGCCPVLSHLLSGQMSRGVPSLSHVPVGPRTMFANVYRFSPKMFTSEV
jgi:hypothetical protein